MPLLYLTAEAVNPWPIEVTPTRDPVLDTMAYYYSAINKILAGEYVRADRDAICAWALTREAKSKRGVILNLISVTAFLAGVSLEAFTWRFSAKYRIMGERHMGIWDDDTEAARPSLSGLFGKFEKLIERETARRAIVDLSDAVSAIRLDQLKEFCKGVDPGPVLEELGREKKVAYELEDRIVRFRQLDNEPEIIQEVVNVSKLFP
jgi:hypothetical protein